MELTLPIWGQWGILGLSLGFNVFYAVQRMLGKIPSQDVVDQANRTTEQALMMADKWQHAWEVAEARSDKNAETLEKVVVTGETVLRILENLPPIMHPPGEAE